MTERSAQSNDEGYGNWLPRRQAHDGVFDRLEARYRDQHDLENLCRILLAREQAEGVSLRLYQKIEETAKALGRWPEIQPKLLDDAKSSRETLAAIYLYEQEWDAAIGLVHDTRTTWYRDTENIRAQVARGVATHRPEAALSLYRGLIQDFIDQKNREAYAQAARYAVALRDIYRTILHDEAAWHDYLTGLLASNSRRRALQEEFRKVV